MFLQSLSFDSSHIQRISMAIDYEAMAYYSFFPRMVKSGPNEAVYTKIIYFLVKDE